MSVTYLEDGWVREVYKGRVWEYHKIPMTISCYHPCSRDYYEPYQLRDGRIFFIDYKGVQYIPQEENEDVPTPLKQEIWKGCGNGGFVLVGYHQVNMVSCCPFDLETLPVAD